MRFKKALKSGLWLPSAEGGLTEAEIYAYYSTVEFYHDMAGTATALRNTTPNTDTLTDGSGWAWTAGTTDTNGDRLRTNGSGVAASNGTHNTDYMQYCQTIDASADAPDCSIEADIILADENRFAGIVWRWSDENNFMYVRFKPTNHGSCQMVKRESGSNTVVGSPSSFEIASGAQTITARVVLIGDDAHVFVNGTKVQEYTNSFNNTVTRHGLIKFTQNTPTFDNFRIRT